MPLPDGAASLGDAYWASQAFPAVAAASGRSPAVAVSEGPPPPPVIVGPVCAGDPFVLLTNLTYGALVQLTVDGAVLGVAAAPGTTYAFPLTTPDDLGTPAPGDEPTVGTLSVQQQLGSGGWSAAATQTIQGSGYVDNFTTGPVLTATLNAGGRAVHVTGATPGLTLWAQSKKWGVVGQAKSASPWFVDGEGDIPIAPELVAGDTISIIAYPATTSSPFPAPTHFTSNAGTCTAE
jgi:hypothetical protein